MTTSAGPGLCRLTVHAPGRRVDLAVPADVSLADLLPVLLMHVGEDAADAGLRHGGWVLQRLGGPVVDDRQTVGTLGLRDGETVYLRRRSDQLPVIAFDDLIDGIATGVRERPGRWTPETTRWSAVALVVAVLATGAAGLTVPGRGDVTVAGVTVAGVTAAAIAVGCFLAAYGVGQVGRQHRIGTALAGGAIGYAGLAGLLVSAPGGPTALAAPRVLTSSVAVIAVVVVGAVALSFARPLFIGLLAAGLICGVAAAVGNLTGLSATAVAGIVVTLATLAMSLVPLVAFRISGAWLPPPPTAPEHIQEDLDPHPSDEVLDRTRRTDRYMSALYAGLCLCTGAGAVVLALGPGWAPPALASVAALVLLLAARPMTSAWHRIPSFAAAGGAVVSVLLTLASTDPLARTLVTVVGVPVGLLAGVVVARYVAGRRLSPYWGRIGDLLHLLAVVAVVPLLLAVLDVYSAVRAIGG